MNELIKVEENTLIVAERAIEQIRRQDIEITGAFLFGEDRKLIKNYYR